MITEQTLKKDVLQFLRKNLSIKLQLPSFNRHISTKINLKLFKSPLGQDLVQNRYQILINIADDLLKKNIINTQKIKQFAEQFFQTITQDVLVLQNNEQIRRNFTRTKDQITYKIQELTIQQKNIEQECKQIEQKQEIQNFLQSSFKTYLNNVKIVSEHYQIVNNIQVYTSINIDNLYSQKIANQDDYVLHYQALLEVMQRLKSNMARLFQELNKCQYYQLPMKSVNFLANCKNLLIQLEPFLIRPDCVFNRLVFHVTKGQKQNTRLITKTFQSNISFTNDIITDIFKSIFLSHIFGEYIKNIQKVIQKQKNDLINHFQLKTTNSQNFYNYIHKLQKNISQINNQLFALKNIIKSGKDKIMRQYLGRIECQKQLIIQNIQLQCSKIIKLAKSIHQMLRCHSKINNLTDSYQAAQHYINQTISSIQQQEILNIKTQKPKIQNVQQLQNTIENRMKQSFILIQNGLVNINQTYKFLHQTIPETMREYFQQSYLPKQQQSLDNLSKKYKQLQITLLNTFQNLRKQKLIKQQQTKKQKQILINQLTYYFDTRVNPQDGFQIRNQDSQSQQIKDNIIQVQKIQFMIYNFVSNKKQEQMDQITIYKSNLECLLQIYEGSMDQKIFQNFLQKLNFQAQDWKQRVNKVKDLTRQLTRYVNILKNLIKENQIKNLFPQVLKLTKNRCQLYQVILDLYQQFTTVYEGCRKDSHLNLIDHGIKLMDQPTYKYTLKLYQFVNKLRAQKNELKDYFLPKITTNYILDQIYQPFAQVFNVYISFDEEQLLNFTLRLQHALNIKTSLNQIIKMYEQTLSKPFSKTYFSSIKKICRQIIQLKQQNEKVYQLQKQQILIHNMAQFKTLNQKLKQYIILSSTYLKQYQQKNLKLNIEFNNKNLNLIQKKIIKQWQLHLSQLEPSPAESRVADFSPKSS